MNVEGRAGCHGRKIAEQLLALAWRQTRADTASLLSFIADADSASRQGSATTRLQAGYAGELARGYLMLARGDSGAALTKLAGIPDQMCILASCFYQKLTQGRLLAAAGRNDAAAVIFDNWLGTRDLSPLYVAASLQRAHTAERGGDEALALRSYQFVADIWRYADLELQPYVAEAKAATARLAMRRGLARSP